MNQKNDLGKVIKLFEELGIGYKQYDWDEKTVIELRVGNHKVSGYTGFISDYCFDENGQFIEININE